MQQISTLKKKINLSILTKFRFSLAFIFLCNLPVLAFVFPDNCYTVDLNTTELGRITLYVPSNYAGYFSTSSDGANLVNCYSGSISMSAFRNSTQYTILFPSFDIPTYRQYGTTNTYRELHIISIVSGNLPNLNTGVHFLPFSVNEYLSFIAVLVLGFILIRSWRR